jgi:hypothetical protein
MDQGRLVFFVPGSAGVPPRTSSKIRNMGRIPSFRKEAVGGTEEARYDNIVY